MNVEWKVLASWIAWDHPLPFACVMIDRKLIGTLSKNTS